MTTGLAYYNLTFSPPTYDFLSFLLAAEMWRTDFDLEYISVQVIPGPKDGFRDDSLPPSVDERRRMLGSVVRPMTRLLPSVRDIITDRTAPCVGKTAPLYGLRLNVEAARRGIYPFRAPSPIKHDRPYVTITLREAEYWPARNSNLPEWLRAAAEIERAGYEVVFIRDTAAAHDPVPCFYSDPGAALNLLHRANVYAGAAMNLGVNNGPMWLAWFMGVPTLVFKMITSECHSTSVDFLAANGLPPGSQYANARPGQMIVWEDDTADVILSAFQEKVKA
jgi:hypothetical protein